jgi:hypothetical protein
LPQIVAETLRAHRNPARRLLSEESTMSKPEIKRPSSKFPSAPRQERMPRVVIDSCREPGTLKEHLANLPCTD